MLDVDLIYRAAEEYPTKSRVDLEGNEIVVYSKEKFTPIFLNVCYSYLFSSQKEFKAVKEILTTVWLSMTWAIGVKVHTLLS